MPEECVVAVYPDIAAAQRAVDQLDQSAFPRESVSLVTNSLANEEHQVRKALESGDESEKDALIGAGIGGLLGILSGSTVLSVASIGVIVVAGPLVALTGAVVGAFLGGIAGWSVHKDHIAAYEKKVHEGQVLVIAHSVNPLAVATAEKTLRATGPLEHHHHAAVDNTDDAAHS